MVRHKHVLALSCLVIILRTVQSQNYQCSLCPVGKYKGTTANEACVNCPADTYQEVLGAISLTQCKPCPSASFAAAGSSSATGCSCAAGYSGDVANYTAGVYTENLAAACTGACATMTNKASGPYPSSYAIDGNIQTFSFADLVVANDAGAVVAFTGMMPWWRVRFEREAVVQSVQIGNEDSRKMQNFYIRVGNDESFTNMNTLALCAGPLTWTQATSNTYTCNAAVRGRYLYIINGLNAPVVLSEVKVRGYLQPATEACVACPGGSYKVSGGPGACTPCAAGQASAAVGSTANTCTNCLANQYSGAGAASCVACPNNTYSLAASTSISSCGCTKGYTALPSTLSCSPFQALYRAAKPWAHYSATLAGWDVTNKQLLDLSGNNRNSPLLGDRAQIVQGTTPSDGVPLNGVSKTLTYIKGSIATALFFPENSIPATFTICSVTRYGGTVLDNQKRILTAAGGNDWLHGHVDQKRGVAYYGSRDIVNPTTGAVTTPSTFNTLVQNVGTATNWMVMCSKNGGAVTSKSILVDGVASGTSTRSDSDPNEWIGSTMDRATQLCINCKSDQKSDWELAHLLIWDTHLSDVDMNIVSEELRSYVPLSTACTSTPSNACVACVAGKYKSSTGGSDCISCGAGKFQPFTAAIAANQCQNCPANADTPAGSTALTNCVCLAGYSADSDGGACTVCPRGSYKTAPGVGTCTQCPANYFSTTDAQTTSTCTACPANSKSPAGSDESTDCVCDAGYTGANGATCLPCVSGTYKTAPGSVVCTLCGNNTYSSAVAATAAGTCKTCQSNSIAVMGSSSYTDCHCLAGYLTNDIGRPNATCTQCSAGSYNPTLGATTCSKCAGGFKSSSPGAVSSEQCLACPVNTYSAPGAANCDACPQNTFAPTPSVVLTDCKCLAGYYATNGLDGGTCQACPAGTFKPLSGAAACTVCPVNTYSTALAANSSSTCRACVTNAVSPVSSSVSSQCLCDYGYKGVVIANNIANLARSCGTGSDACTVTVDSTEPFGAPDYAANWMNDDLTKYDQGNNRYYWWRSEATSAHHWARIEFTSAYVTGIQLSAQGTGINYAGVIVGNNPDVNSADNSICALIPTSAQTAHNNGGIPASGAYMTITCNTPVLGKYIFISNRCNKGTSGVDLGNCGTLTIWELKVSGYIATGFACGACTAGTFKDTLGSAACTDCPVNTYSDMSAARNASACNKCYNNAITAAGSDSILDCGCSSGYEYFVT